MEMSHRGLRIRRVRLSWDRIIFKGATDRPIKVLALNGVDALLKGPLRSQNGDGIHT